MSTVHLLRSRSFTATWAGTGDDRLIRLSGRLVDPLQDGSEWQQTVQRLASPGHLRVDVGAVTVIDARGIGLLADLVRETRARGGSASIACANRRVRRLLTVTGLDSVFIHVPCASAA